MAKDLAVVLNNGGVNSAVATALAAQKHRLVMVHVAREAEDPEDTAITARSRVAFDQQVSHFKPYREHVLSLPVMKGLKPPGAARRGELEASPKRDDSGAVNPYVALIPHLGSAAQFAIEYQAVAIYLGLRTGSQADALSQGTEYVQIWQDLIQLPCQAPDLEVLAPLLELEPWQVVDLGVQINAPLDRTWSCDINSNEPCWACKGCRSREAAFQQAAKPDPLKAVKR